AKEHQLTVLVSISNPPDWVLTSYGPDPDLTTRLTADLVKRYRSTLLAIEIFPGANTHQGWGTQPDPQSYARLIEKVYGDLQTIGPEITLVAAGLKPASSPQDIPDLDFLQALYTAGAAPYMPIIGLRLPKISTDPGQPPTGSNPTSLRHYEAVRDIMLRNSHQNGLIWVTGFSWDNHSLSSPERQATWLEQAFLMMRAQLYIGAAFVQDLNPFTPDLQNHPGIIAIRHVTALDSGRALEEVEHQLSKKSSKGLSKNH
ncbi:MAG: hypothetical protein MUO62_02195, partial [Anaerolineales bacterium]|nr:hypothetical protein [Anaerolineales bacterium]